MPHVPAHDHLFVATSINLPAVPKAARWGLLAAGIVGALLWWLIPAEYEATAFLRVSRGTGNILGDRGDEPTDRAYQIYKQTHRELITGPIVLSAALRAPGISQLPMIRGRDRDQNEAVEWLMNKVNVDTSPDSQMLQVRLDGPDEEQPMKVVDAIVDAYMREIVQLERNEENRVLDTLNQMLLRKRLDYKQRQERFQELADRSLAVADDPSKESSIRGNASVELTVMKRELEALGASLAELDQRANELNVNLNKPPRVTVMQTAIVSESTNWKVKWLQITGACFLVFGVTTTAVASWGYLAKLSLVLTVIYLCSMLLTWALFLLGMLRIEGPTLDDYFAMFGGMSSSGVSLVAALSWSGVWTVGYVLGLTAIALLKYNLKRD